MQKFTGFQGHRVLVVDDHATSRNYVLAALRQSGISVKAARNVSDAGRMAARYCPDVVVSDWRLPDGTGRDVCNVIRSGRPARVPQARFVLLCGNPQDAPPDWLAGAVHRVLRKPCSPRALLEAVQPDGSCVRETPAPVSRAGEAELVWTARSELRARLPGLAAAIDGKSLSEAGLIAHQLTAAAALCRAQSLESVLRELGDLCSEKADPSRMAATWCSLESAAREFLAGSRP